MKTIIERKGIFVVLLSAALIPTAATSQASVYAWRGELAFAPLPAGDVRAAGWLKAKLELVRDGMGGNLDRLDPPQFAYPFVRRDFEANVGGKGYIDWCAEMSGEYWLGLVELAYALGDEALLKKAGDVVKAGTPVALVGSSGSLTKGDHLRFELWYAGDAVDPAAYISF